MTREALLRRQILHELNLAGGLLMPHKALHNAVILALSPPPTLAEFNLGVSALEAQGYVRAVINSIDGEARWALTDKGRLALVELLGM